MAEPFTEKLDFEVTAMEQCVHVYSLSNVQTRDYYSSLSKVFY